jgi:O-antigen ligase
MELAAWNAGLAVNDWRNPRCLGRWLMWLGIAAMLVGSFLTPPWGKFGIACAIAGALLARPPIHRLPAIVWIGSALSLWLLASMGAGWLRGEPGAGRLPALAYVWLAIPLGAACAVDARWRRQALLALIAVAAASTAVGLLQFCVGLGGGPLKIDAAGERFARATGFCAVHLHFGYNGAILAALCLAGGIGPSAPWLWSGRILAVVILVISGARNGLLGGAAAIAAALMARGGRWLWGGLAAGIIALLLVGSLMAMSAPEKMQAMLAGQDGRLPIWRAATATLAERPVLGYGGRDAWKARYLQIYDQVNPDIPNEFTGSGPPHPHNWFLTLANDNGIPALLLHLSLLVGVFVLLWRRRIEHPATFQAGCGVLTAGLVCGQFEPLPVLAAAGAGFHAALGLCLGSAYGSDERTRTSSTGP